jgi:two-component system sensor histidine kinase LytS
MIQPLVENAVGHGMPADGRPLTITVSAARHVEGLVVSVSDDGTGMDEVRLDTIFEPGTGKGLGIALRNVRDRLTGYYGAGSSLEIESEPGEGTTIRLVISPVPG